MAEDDDQIDLKEFHDWILSICDPDFNLCHSLNKQIIQLLHMFSSDSEAESENILDNPPTSLKLLLSDNIKQKLTRQGYVRLKLDSGALVEATGTKHGKLNGFCRVLNECGDLDFFGCIIDGKLKGPCWKSLPGSGFIISPNLSFTGDNILYLYPDCRLGYLGRFEEDLLEEGNLVEVVGYEPRLQETILMPKIRKLSDQIYNCDISSKENFSKFPLVKDPYEDYFVQVKKSKFENAGEGLHAKVDIELGTVIAFYNGVRVLADTDTERPTPYKISLDDDYDLDIPDDYTSTSKYTATSAHKVCHSFKPNCEVDDFFHPRFGEIRCVAALQDIKKGDELTINYRYNLTLAPTWYRLAWAKYQKSVRRLPEWRSAVQDGGISRSSSRTSMYSSFADLYLS